ncbi:MAG: hypothetical protein KAG56_06840 [Sulfurovaceae bacterium]|nr:hypothetical protein [Sulfurovaceae bacterium]
MKSKVKKLILLPIILLFFGCGSSDSDFKSKIEFFPPDPYTVGVNGLSDYILISSGDMGYITNPQDSNNFYGQSIRYDDVEEIKLEENKNHIYYATNCIDTGHLEHKIQTNEVNVVNLSDLDISVDSHTLELSYGDKNVTISNDISPCSITTILSLKDFKYSSSNLEARLNGTDGYNMNGSHYLEDKYNSLVSLDIIIFEDYNLSLIAIFSHELENEMAIFSHEKEVEWEREHYEEDKDEHHWDWD